MLRLVEFITKNMQKNITTSHLIEFSIENFGCFRDRVTFSMETRKDAKNSFLLKNSEETLLKTGIIYGPNASGKSTLLDAMQFMDAKIRKSMDEEHPEYMKSNPFLLEEGFGKKPLSFEITFALGSNIYRYEFSLDQDHTVLHEALVEIKKTTEKDIFTREKQNFSIDKKFTENNLIEDATRKDALLLSTASQLNGEMANKITNFFRNGINFFTASRTRQFTGMTAEKSNNDPKFKQKVLDILQKFDFCFSGFRTEMKDIDIPDKFRKILEEGGEKIPQKAKTVEFEHNVYNSEGEIFGSVDINISNQSEGTQKLFQELGPILETLEDGSILVIDELSTHFHPAILKAIVDLFHSKETNPYNAQLIFTTHETSLLANTEEIDRDSFWFTERDQYGRAHLFSLSEFKERKDRANIDKRYLNGVYGAVPFIRKEW